MKPMDMISVEEGEVRIIHIKGDIEYPYIDVLVSDLQAAVKDAPNGCVLDFSKTAYIDSGGARAIIVAYREVRKSDSSLALVVTNKTLKEMLDIMSLDRLPGLYVFDNLESAIEAVRK